MAPALGPHTIGRPRLDALLDDGATRRLVTVIADAGFGKSTLLASWASRRSCAWYTVSADDRGLSAIVSGLVGALRLKVPALSAAAVPGGTRGPDADAEQPIRALAHATAIADALETHLTEDLVLVLDDLHEISPGDPAAKLVEGLVRVAPPRLHLVIASRTPAPFRVERLRGRGQLLEIDGSTLAFTDAETAEVLQTVLGADETGLASVLHTAVQGWPAAARLAGEALRAVPPADRDARLRRALRPGGPVFDYLAEEVFASEPDDARRLVAVAAELPYVSAELSDELDVPAAEDALERLITRGFLVSDEDGERFRLHPLLRDFALARLALPDDEGAALVTRAARWLAGQGQERDALALFRRAGATDELVALLRERGGAMVARGDAEEVVAAVAELRDGGFDQLEGEARQVLGDWTGAQACFERLVGDGPIPPAVAWRLGLIQYVRGELQEALATYGRGVLDGLQPAEEALLLAWWASAHWMRGEIDRCRELVAEALAAAKAAADDRALAVSHTVLAMLAAVDSDPRANAAHYLRALDHAERAGDTLQQIRIHVNHGSHHIAEAQYAQGVAEVDVAIRLADLAGFAMFRALAMNNRGEALLGLGRLDEAIAELDRSRALYQRLESRLVAQPLATLGEVYRHRGDRAMARACYEEAASIAEQDRNLQALVPSLAGLARLRVEDEPDEALELAERAVGWGPVLGHTSALLALGWVTLHRGELDRATAAADDAAALCRRRRDRAGLAEALELQAAVVAQGNGHPDQLLHEAVAIRREIGDPLGEARLELMLAQSAPGEDGRELALRAQQRFLDAGAGRYAAAALSTDEAPPVRIECLGGFRVLRAGKPVPLGDWPSRKARDLLKILVARRCRPVPRSQLVDLLWPDDDESVASPRLSVALSTVRSVLDPGKRYAADRFVRADRATVWLDGNEAMVDVESFLADANAGLERAGSSRSVLLLRAAEASYAGDFLEEDVYADWAGGLREEARVAYVRVARALADRAVSTGDHDSAAGYLLRILQRDVYDERAHLALVRSFVGGGAHGEARRAYRAYVSRMEELGVEPAPFPAGRERDFKAV
jgi:DNA-binding SARP family transcriptional activator